MVEKTPYLRMHAYVGILQDTSKEIHTWGLDEWTFWCLVVVLDVFIILVSHSLPQWFRPAVCFSGKTMPVLFSGVSTWTK